MRTNLYAAVCCLEREAATAERKAPLLDAEGRHDDAFAAREVAASCRLAAGLLRAEERRRYDKEMLANARHDFSSFVYLFALRD